MPDSTMTALSAAAKSFVSGLPQIKSLSEKEVEAFYSALAPLIQPSIILRQRRDRKRARRPLHE